MLHRLLFKVRLGLKTGLARSGLANLGHLQYTRRHRRPVIDINVFKRLWLEVRYCIPFSKCCRYGTVPIAKNKLASGTVPL